MERGEGEGGRRRRGRKERGRGEEKDGSIWTRRKLRESEG